MTIRSFVAMFAALGAGAVAADRTYGPVLFIVSGVFIGSETWWLALTGSISLIRGRISKRTMALINYAFGITILGSGLYQLYLSGLAFYS